VHGWQGFPIHWTSTFAVALDSIWRSRNDFIFNNRQEEAAGLVGEIQMKIEQVLESLELFKKVGGQSGGSESSDCIGWNLSRVGYI